MKHVLTTGPMVMGTNWYMDMFTPDRWGYVTPGGDNAGGHSWLIIGVDRYRKSVSLAIWALLAVSTRGARTGDRAVASG
jgi:hypothetical protein